MPNGAGVAAANAPNPPPDGFEILVDWPKPEDVGVCGAALNADVVVTGLLSSKLLLGLGLLKAPKPVAGCTIPTKSGLGRCTNRRC